jgi:hypothetical protein
MMNIDVRLISNETLYIIEPQFTDLDIPGVDKQ